MNPRNLKLLVETKVDIETPYAQINSGTKVCIENDAEGVLRIRSDIPIGIKFMSMTVATISEIEISEKGEVLGRSINAPFLVKAQVENEICKAASKIPFGIVEIFLMRMGVKSGDEIRVKINEDKTVELESDKGILIGKDRRQINRFKIETNGRVSDTDIDLNSVVWEKFESFLR